MMILHRIVFLLIRMSHEAHRVSPQKIVGRLTQSLSSYAMATNLSLVREYQDRIVTYLGRCSSSNPMWAMLATPEGAASAGCCCSYGCCAKRAAAGLSSGRVISEGT